MSVKGKVARKAAKTTAKHTAYGAAAKLRREPVRAVTLLLLGAVAGFLLGRLLRPSETPAGPSFAPPE